MTGKQDKTKDVVMIGNAEDDATLLALCPDLPEWPKRWQMEPNDLHIGDLLVAAFRPFLRYLICQDLAPKTLKRHLDHLWMLGGEIIRRRHADSDLQRLSVPALLLELVDEEAGPLIWPRITASEQSAFDGTCRRLQQFLVQQAETSHGS